VNPAVFRAALLPFIFFSYLLIGMGNAINFNNQLQLFAHEVCNYWHWRQNAYLLVIIGRRQSLYVDFGIFHPLPPPAGETPRMMIGE
jgi:hypothetical protein